MRGPCACSNSTSIAATSVLKTHAGGRLICPRNTVQQFLRYNYTPSIKQRARNWSSNPARGQDDGSTQTPARRCPEVVGYPRRIVRLKDSGSGWVRVLQFPWRSKSFSTTVGPMVLQHISSRDCRKWTANNYASWPQENRRLWGESEREISSAPACVILRLGSGMRIVVRGSGVPLGLVQMNVDEMI